MQFTTNAIYNYIESKINRTERPVYCSSVYEPVPASFPACFIIEIGHINRKSVVNLKHTDEQHEVSFEVQVSTNNKDTALSTAYRILEDCEKGFRELGFYETYSGRVENMDSTVIRLVGRFTRFIGSGDSMPTSANNNE